jgi:hypothetical protein
MCTQSPSKKAGLKAVMGLKIQNQETDSRFSGPDLGCIKGCCGL